MWEITGYYGYGQYVTVRGKDMRETAATLPDGFRNVKVCRVPGK